MKEKEREKRWLLIFYIDTLGLYIVLYVFSFVHGWIGLVQFGSVWFGRMVSQSNAIIDGQASQHILAEVHTPWRYLGFIDGSVTSK